MLLKLFLNIFLLNETSGMLKELENSCWEETAHPDVTEERDSSALCFLGHFESLRWLWFKKIRENVGALPADQPLPSWPACCCVSG